MQSLKGIFEVPKMNHRRDFLRENKLNLRELQKTTTHKLTQQKLELEKRQQKHLQRFHKSHSQEQFVGAARRSTSQRRYDNTDNRQHEPPKILAAAAVSQGGQRQSHLSFRRSLSQQRESGDNNMQAIHPRTTFDLYAGNNQGGLKDNRVRSASVASIVSKAESCDKEIQTEDIIDEDFLYEALKKCSSTEIDFNKKNFRGEMRNEINLSKSNVSLHSQPLNSNDDNRSMHSRNRVPYDYNEDILEEHKLRGSQSTPRSQYSQLHNGHHQNQIIATTTGQQRRDDYDDHLEDRFEHLQIDTQMQREHETQLSGRSRQTMCSDASKRKSNGLYKLGNREDIRLPRYLEKEKREKEEERQRVMSRDPNCPLGHYALTEEERLSALNSAQRKMDSLVQELNRMPMTTETLRIRKRKVEIEKELSQIELDIRAFSKPKVYVVTDPSMTY